MKILVFGAGIIGSIYAARAYQAGHDVTLLVRNNRYEALLKNGIILKNSHTERQTTSYVPLTLSLRPEDFYDLIIVSVQLNQLDSVVPYLKKNTNSPLILFMLNNPEGWDRIIYELRPKHIILGFPGIGGIHEGNRINYFEIKQQKTTIGEINGSDSSSIQEIKKVFRSAGFEVAVSTNIQAWLKIHAVFVSCMSAAIVRENGDSKQLGNQRNSVRDLVQSIREGFLACKNLGIPIIPKNLKTIFLVMPQWFCIWYWQKALKGKIGTVSLAPHAMAAKAEMQTLSEMVLTMVHSSALPTPTLDKLLLSFTEKKTP